MSDNETNLATVGVPKATIEALYIDVLRAALQLKIAAVLCQRACVPYSERDHILDRILAGVRYVEAHARSTRADADDPLPDDEHIGSVAERELARMAVEFKAREALSEADALERELARRDAERVARELL